MKNIIKKECLKNPEEESCGLVLFFNKRAKIMPCYNWAKNKQTNFEIEPRRFVDAFRKGEIFGVYHSHIDSSSKFSKKDIERSEESMLPYFLYSLKSNTHNVYIPKSVKKGSKSFVNFLSRTKRDYCVRKGKE